MADDYPQLSLRRAGDIEICVHLRICESITTYISRDGLTDFLESLHGSASKYELDAH